MAGIDDVNRHPVIHARSTSFAEAAWRYDSNHGNADLDSLLYQRLGVYFLTGTSAAPVSASIAKSTKARTLAARCWREGYRA